MTTPGTGKRRTGASAREAAGRQALPAARDGIDKGPSAGPQPGPVRAEHVE